MKTWQHLMTPEHLFGFIEQFCAFGVHRTGWEPDQRVTEWLIESLVKQGVSASSHAFEFPCVETKAAYVEVDGHQLEGTPLYDGAPTGPEGISGRLVSPDDDWSWPSLLVLDDARRLPQILESAPEGLAGVILVTGDADGDIVLRNAERIDAPFALPVIQVARKDAAPLLEPEGKTARIVIDFKRQTSTATNVIGRLESRAAKGLVVVMTPKSGWFTCASERGGGIAITLSLAAYLAGLQERQKNVLFLFTSGHEINQYGLACLLRDNPGLRDEAEAWVHLGASIGSSRQTWWRLYSRDDELRAQFTDSLSREGFDDIPWADKDDRPIGESRHVFDKRFVSTIGMHEYFHSPNDIPSLAVDANRVASFGRAFARLLTDMVSA
jgi:hypothetical protein